MESNINFAYRFHPVGQGLFSTGTLLPWQQGTAPFHWTFDCGSMAKKADWIQQVNWYRDLVLQENMLNLLCISHFDKDHVSGLGELLDGKHVDTVVIPYCTPIERLLVGAMQERRRGQDDGEYNEFLSNPVAFVIERAASIRQIIVVHRSPPEEPNWPFGGNVLPDSPVGGLKDRPLNPDRRQRRHEQRPEREQWRVNTRDSLPSNNPPPFAAGLPESITPWGGTLSFMGESGNLYAVAPTSHSFCPQWEFLFFHKPESPEVVTVLIWDIDWLLKEAERRTGHPLGLSEALRDKETLKKIKSAYHRAFPGNKRFNTAGVCMYSGPLADNLQWTAVSAPYVWHGVPPIRPSNGSMTQWVHGHHWRGPDWRPAILYSGDADFQPEQHRDELHQFLTLDRWQSLYILQVPHHGSMHNWQVGSANEFHHQWSVFSADPQYKHHHPDQAVLLDLLGRNPLLVDRIAGVGWSGLCHFEDP